MKAADAVGLVRKHGVMLMTARGPVPNLAEAVVGAPIRGGWWAHPAGKAIYAAADAVGEHQDVLVCRLVGGRITLIHRRLWPALVCLIESGALSRRSLARVRQEHTASGKHVNHEQPYPKWVPQEARAAADGLDMVEAWRLLGIRPADVLGKTKKSR